DYRYFPEPDLPPLVVMQPWIDEIRATLPELPDARRARYEADWGVRRVDADILTSEMQVADFFEQAVAAYGTGVDRPQRVVNWITGELFRLIYAAGDAQDLRQIADLPIRPAQLAALLRLVDEKTINLTIAKKVLEMMAEQGEDPGVIVERQGWALVSDTSVIDAAIQAILDANPDELTRYRGGEAKLFGFFMGQTMRATKGQGDPQMVKQRLQEMLRGE
ncbi:MAG: Asp-tRNA(Asn)/Glu-tRNA(Gln) amidotransferase GatCAB subunit B, partial [Caldilineaceae bacterium]|nr:Asp-tRNA(Asn)/Glu-tRNA(Gln) amidotransferase GatCAB subunit B [Caldilineaceae bacterium]